MNDENPFDPRTIAERCLMNSTESRALKALADELTVSKSALLRLAFLKFAREKHDGVIDLKVCQEAAGYGSAEPVLNLANED